MTEARRLIRSKVISYVINRHNKDGGYTFCQGTESNAQDTYYGLAILSLLDSSFPNAEKTAEFIGQIRLDNIYSTYYVAKASLLLGKDTDNLKPFAYSVFDSEQYFGSTDVFSEIPSEFQTTLMALELANMLNINLKTDNVADWLLSFKNCDDGFGAKGASNINSTYFAVASLYLLKKPLEDISQTLNFLRACEKPYGGFTVTPINFTPYMEHTYYGVMAIDLFGEKCKYPEQTFDWLLQCQNGNGGFARSDLGISTFENTYYALMISQKIAISRKTEK